MKKRFSPESLKMANNYIKLDFIGCSLCIEHYKVKISKIHLIQKLYISLSLIVTILFQELLNIDEVTLNSEMVVAKNCAIRMNGHDNIKIGFQLDLKKIVDAEV
jgi:hypothetical protein